VVLKASTGFADEADQQLAADLAAHFSRAKGNQHVAVMMVPVEQLQRIAGAGPGTVQFKGGNICWAVPERGLEHLNLTAK
jgi:predicted ribosome quality control (RQC) complex YloA/Tae2 family protein